MRRMNIMVLLVILPLLIPGRLSAMLDAFGKKVVQLYCENKASFNGAAGVFLGAGGVSLLCATKNLIQKSDYISHDEKFVPLNPVEIVLLQSDIRAKLQLDEQEELPENVVDALINKGFEKGKKVGWDKASIKYGTVLRKLEEIFPKGEPPDNWEKLCIADRETITKFLDKHPGYNIEVEKRAELGNFALKALYEHAAYLCTQSIIKVFENKPDGPTKEELLKTPEKREAMQDKFINPVENYLKAQMSIISQKHNNEIKQKEDAVKLLVAKKIVENYSEKEAPPGDFGTWFDRIFKENYISKLSVAKMLKKDDFDPKNVCLNNFVDWFQETLKSDYVDLSIMQQQVDQKKQKRSIFGRLTGKK